MRLSPSRSYSVLLAVGLGAVAACDAGTGGVFATGGSGGQGSGTGTGDTVTAASNGGAGPTANSTAAQFMTDGSSGAGVKCNVGMDEDFDKDGWSITQGDCNDCDSNVNPGALEVKITEPDPVTNMIPEPADEDCDMQIDNVVEQLCDMGIPLEAQPGLDGARAIELCKESTGPKDWGIVEAAFVRANGAATPPSDAYGIMSNFGPNVAVRKGERMLALSSGRARLPGQTGSCNTVTPPGNSCTNFTAAGTAPPGFPQDPPSCPVSANINDDIGLQLELRSPSNANGFAFDFKFYSFEYPEWVCDSYNDQFIALVAPPPMGSLNGNVSFDSQNNPVSVNFGLFNVCDGCMYGTSEMDGTGFNTWNDAGATEWLQTTSPVKGLQTFTIRFAIWDTGDKAFDSTVLVDNFRWIADGGTVVVGTTPPPQ